MLLRHLLIGTAVLSFAACSGGKVEKETPATATSEPVAAEMTSPEAEATPVAVAPDLDAILAMQDDAAKARYQYRHPKETLEFFGIEPGMTVAEVLPGEGWYSKILLPYLGDEGRLIGIDYNVDMWSNFGGFADETFLSRRKEWPKTWSNSALAWRQNSQTEIDAFAFGAMPANYRGAADAVLYIRSLHHLNRFNAAYWDQAIKDTFNILKPGGIVGIVQHRAPEASPETWANGDNGYLKQSFVIKKFEEAGFELVGEPSEINANPKDVPTSDDTVWRLPPNLGTSGGDTELKAKMEAIGESDRMTLLFRKPE